MTDPKTTDPADQVKTQPNTPAAATAADARVKELEAENARLREQLVEAGQTAEAGKPHEPSFLFSEGNREELERTGRTQSPFTGKLYVGSGVDDAREATPDEFKAAKPAERPKKTAPRATGRRGK